MGIGVFHLLTTMNYIADELKEYFLAYGSIVEHQIMLDHKTGRSRGFGFVTFDSEDSVEKVFSVGKIHELGGCKFQFQILSLGLFYSLCPEHEI